MVVITFEKEGIMKVEARGGQGGRIWEWNGQIEKILVKHGTVVDSIAFGFIENGHTVWSGRFGGDGGHPSEISIEDPNELLVTLKVTTGVFRSSTPLITSVTFITNKQSYGPYGKDTSDQFNFRMEGRNFVGFHGRSGQFLDAIGFRYLDTSRLPNPISSSLHSSNEMDDTLKIGPWGGKGGKAWQWSGPIQKIIVHHGTVVDSLTFGFIKNGDTVWSGRFGGDGGHPTEISIEEPDEYLVTIKGTTGMFRYPTPVLTSLTFISNERTYGPFGKETPNQFSIPVDEWEVGGFHGRCGRLLDAIGFILVPLGE